MTTRQHNKYKIFNELTTPEEMKVKENPKNPFVITLEGEDHLNFLLQNFRIVVVMVSATWCQPCKVVKPKFVELATIVNNDAISLGMKKPDIVFALDDIDSENSAYKSVITAIPQFFIHADGNPTPSLGYGGTPFGANKGQTAGEGFELCEKKVHQLWQRLKQSKNTIQ